MEQNVATKRVFNFSGMFALALRLVVGWTYFSAFWRRLVLENKLVEDAPGYIGEKFNHFLPNALGIKPLIEYLVTTPDVLWWSMVAFTIIEGIVGLLFMLGYFTRLASIGAVSYTHLDVYKRQSPLYVPTNRRPLLSSNKART